jgi:hypothetical protein
MVGAFFGFNGKLELTNACLSILPMFGMSLFMLYDKTHAIFIRCGPVSFGKE